jgi:hypothetical protein
LPNIGIPLRQVPRKNPHTIECNSEMLSGHYMLTAATRSNKSSAHETTCPGGGMVDALASGASGRKAVEVRVLFWAPRFSDISLLYMHYIQAH